MRRRIFALLLIAACSGAGAAAVAGARTERPAAAHIPAIPVAKASASDLCPIPAKFRPAFLAAARDTDLPLALLTSVAQVESRFQPRAMSSAGAQGLLQLMPTTAAELKLDAQDPTSNVLAGARYLHLLLQRFNSSDLALAAYNAGPTAVARAGAAPNNETATYVANVTNIWRLLHGCS